MLQKDEIDKK